MPRYAQCFVRLDLESTGLDPDEDEILEVAMFISDFDLKPYPGTKFNATIKITPEGEARVAGNDIVKKMHEKSGVLADARKSTMTRAEAEKEMIRILEQGTTFHPGEFMLAGSGIAHFDKGMLASQFPYFNERLSYYMADIGIFRRLTILLNRGKEVIPQVKESSDYNVKTHRAWDDITAHFKEAHAFRNWLTEVRGKDEKIAALEKEIRDLKAALKS